MNSATKTQMIKEWLEKGNIISQVMAIQMFDCLDVKNVIYRLRKEGLNIKSETTGNYTHYFIEKEHEEGTNNG